MDQPEHAAVRPIRLIGLTGSLASGKSTAGAYLQRQGFRVVDADEIAKALLLDPIVRERIRSRFGVETYGTDGQPDRKRIAELIFSNREHREWLNGMIHPLVRKRVREIAESGNGPLIYDVPLLFESGAHKETDTNIMIDASLETRIMRAEQRNGWSREEFLARESAQMPPEQKRALADFVIENDADLQSLQDRLDRLIEILKKRIDP